MIHSETFGFRQPVALIPIIFFFLALAVFRMKGYVAGFITVVLTVLVALFAYKMPFTMAMAATGYGFLYGLWPIAWIIIMSVFLYKISVKTGQFDVIRASVLSITNDHRLLVILIGFSFGAFLEGAAGFGAPVAITAKTSCGAWVKSFIRKRSLFDCKYCTSGVRSDGNSDYSCWTSNRY